MLHTWLLVSAAYIASTLASVVSATGSVWCRQVANHCCLVKTLSAPVPSISAPREAWLRLASRCNGGKLSSRRPSRHQHQTSLLQHEPMESMDTLTTLWCLTPACANQKQVIGSGTHPLAFSFCKTSQLQTDPLLILHCRKTTLLASAIRYIHGCNACVLSSAPALLNRQGQILQRV